MRLRLCIFCGHCGASKAMSPARAVALLTLDDGACFAQPDLVCALDRTKVREHSYLWSSVNPTLSPPAILRSSNGALDRTKIATVGKAAIGAFLLKLQVHKSLGDFASGSAMYNGHSDIPVVDVFSNFCG